MTKLQREKHIKKVMSMLVSDTNIAHSECHDNPSTSTSTCNTLSSDLSCLTSCLSLPLTAIQAISRRATDAIVPAPGYPAGSCMVVSRSGTLTHVVQPTRSGGFSCGKDCPQYKSSKLCSHIVAVAERSDKLSSLVLSLQREKRSGPNVTKLALTTMPKGCGRKGSKAPPKKKQALEVQQRCALTSGAALQTGQQTNIGLVYVTQASESAPSSTSPYSFPSAGPSSASPYSFPSAGPSSASPYSFPSAGVTSASAPSSASPYSFPGPYSFPHHTPLE